METKVSRGGKRLGAGRKRGLASIKAEEARKYTVSRIAEELEPIIAGQIELAKGTFYESEDTDGNKTIYRQLPNAGVAQYLISQSIGKPKETVDMNVAPVFSLRALAVKREELKKLDRDNSRQES